MSESNQHLGTELTASIFGILNKAPALAQIVEDRIYNNVPDKENFPYIVLGDEDNNGWTTHTSRGFKGTTTLNLWSRPEDGRGKAEVKRMLALVYQALDDVDLGIAGRCQVDFSHDRDFILDEDDNRTFHGVMIFKFIFGGNEK